MYTGAFGEVYLEGAGAGQGFGGFEQWSCFPGEGQDAAVVVRVGVESEDPDTGNCLDGTGDARDLLPVAALVKVGTASKSLPGIIRGLLARA